ncbi:MAG TPA: ABC transporter permease [Acidimicrobiales bacterium]|nr:ABC transporter permease [Acidimicrobiales bacterium]
MTQASLVPPSVRRLSSLKVLGQMFADTSVITWRNLLGYVRIPEAAFFSSVQPIMFVLLFRYVFGGAIPIPGVSYVDYLMPGIFVQTVAFGAIGTSIGLAQDMHTGLIERFRALPMSRSAVLAGRTFADLVRNVVVVGIITAVGFAVGFRLQTNIVAFFAALGILLLFAYALSWGFALIGLSAPNAETAQVMSFPVLFPMTFASSIFVPVDKMPGWLQGFANNQPVSIVVDSSRALMIGGPTASYVIRAIIWSVGLLVVLGPLAVRKYRRMD